MKGKDLEKIRQFQKLLSQNYFLLRSIKEQEIQDQEIDFSQQKIKEQKFIEDIKIMNENFKKLEIILCDGKNQLINTNADKIKQKKQQKNLTTKQNLRNQNFFVLKHFIKPLCSSYKSKRNSQIQLADIFFCLQKHKKKKFMILYPNQQYISNSRRLNQLNSDQNLFQRILNKVEFSINIINLENQIVLNMFLKADDTENFDELLKSRNLHVEIDSYNFHYLFEETRNQSVKEIQSAFDMNMNDSETIIKFFDLIKGNQEITLNQKNSQYDFCNQLTKGFTNKMLEYNYIKSQTTYFYRWLENSYKYIEINKNPQHFFCQQCKIYMKSNEDGNIEYPTFLYQKGFCHESCQLVNILKINTQLFFFQT